MSDPNLEQIAQEAYDTYFLNNGQDNGFYAHFGGPDHQKVNGYAEWFNLLVSKAEPWTLDYKPYGSNDTLKLYARYLAQPKYSGKTAIVAHGLGSNSLNVGPWARLFHDLGFNVLAPDARGYGLSQDPCRNLGILDSDDIVSWVNELVKKDPKVEIVLFGCSMGAANILESSYKNQSGNVIAVIEDCAYSQLDSFVMYGLQNERPDLTHDQNLQVVQLLDGILYKNQNVHLRGGLTESGLSTTTLPILTIHGTADVNIPPQSASRISSRVLSSIKYEHRYFCEGAPHYQSISYGGGYDAYKAQVEQFLDHVANPDKPTNLISYEIRINNLTVTGNQVGFFANVVKQTFFGDEKSGPGLWTIERSGAQGVGITGAGNFDIVVPSAAAVAQPALYFETDVKGNCQILLVFDVDAPKPYNVTIRRMYGPETYERTLSIS